MISLAWWSLQDRPGSWRSADWGSSGLLPPAADVPEAALYVMAARTGGTKGAVSVHSWVVFKGSGDANWTRAEVVGWGQPVRINAYAADARWYSNDPYVIGRVSGPLVDSLLPDLRRVIDTYPWGERGDYVIWPGPNSNTFVAHILRQLPEIGLTLPPHAVGRAWTGPGATAVVDGGGDVHFGYSGMVGLSVGPRTGFEVHLLGQSFGVDVLRPALKLPGIGRVSVWSEKGDAQS
ncbi:MULTISPECIES: DUF3750 domain-containing protein [Jannaschia]|nr:MULTISPECIES: DUF3750 domain-containing protein [unclassified Jannaschia]